MEMFFGLLDSEFKKFYLDERAEQHKFDAETIHGVVSAKEEEWENKYDVH